MQKGFATLEIIFGTLIIAVLLSCTLPNVERIIDRAALDYETKRLYSELRFLQAMNRSVKFNVKGTERDDLGTPDAPFMQITPGYRKYQIMRGNNTPLRAAHKMQNVEFVEFKTKVPSNKITFDDTGQATDISGKALSNSIILTPHFGKRTEIVFDSVGRIRGGRADD